jgi:hypothetical protein
MKRLIDDPELSGAHASLAKLVRQAEPYRPNPFRKRMVLSRLQAPSRGGFRLRGPALIVALLFIGTATAGAAVGYDWGGSSAEQERAADPAATLDTNAPARPITATRATVDPPKPPEAKPEPEAARPMAVDSPARRAEERSSKAARTAVARSSSAAEKALPPGEDPAPVLEAIRALRRSGDPARAQKLLDEYLASNPRGALSEDALGLAIEAAAARHDPRAADYARRYLARFPNGRFRAVALKSAQNR